jgi:adenylate kinase family enzyme
MHHQALGASRRASPGLQATLLAARAEGVQMHVQRILIIGPCGAGKSTLARVIGGRLGLPAVHLDSFFWNPGWVQTEIPAFRDQVAKAVNGDAWVMDGNYTTQSLDLRLPRADAVIWLDLPRRVYFPRVLSRVVKNYGRVREDIGRGCPERIDLPFFKWVWTYPARRQEHAEIIAGLPPGVRSVILRSRAEVATFTSSLPQSLTTA